MSDRVLVTGATGFVGSHVVQAFVEGGYEVRCGLRATSDLRWISTLPVELVSLDLARSNDLSQAVKEVDVVVHAAGITRARNSSDYHLVNAEGTRRLAVAAVAAGVRRFVLISSLAARGPDASAKNGSDDLPTSVYGRSKLDAEENLRAFGQQMELVVLRPAAVYGPRDTDLLPLFKMARSGWLIVPPTGSDLLQPVYATDAARATLAAVGKPVGFGPYSVAEMAHYTWQEVAEGLERALGRSVRVVHLPVVAFKLVGHAAEWAARLRGVVPIFDERRAQDLAVHTWTCDPSITEQELGWQAEVVLFEGLERTAQWYSQAGWI
jgi:nucleoside-diphosphate-sugar epimerase